MNGRSDGRTGSAGWEKQTGLHQEPRLTVRLSVSLPEMEAQGIEPWSE